MMFRSAQLAIVLCALLLPSLLHAQEIHWRYDFTPGEVLHYRHIFDQNEMPFEDTFVWRWETSMKVESVDPQGRATIQLTSVGDTLERATEMIQPAGVRVIRPKRMPRIRVVVSPWGDVSHGEIIEASAELIELRKRQASAAQSWSLDDSTFAAKEAQYWFFRLPALPDDARVGTIWSDTTMERRPFVKRSSEQGGRATIVEQIDTAISSYRIAGFRAINGFNTVKVVQTKTFRISLGPDQVHNWSAASELYFDTRTGLLVRREETLVRTSSDAMGTVQKYVVELVGKGEG
jgi:hypothetical protein